MTGREGGGGGADRQRAKDGGRGGGGGRGSHSLTSDSHTVLPSCQPWLLSKNRSFLLRSRPCRFSQMQFAFLTGRKLLSRYDSRLRNALVSDKARHLLPKRLLLR